MPKLKLDSLTVRSFVTGNEANVLVGGAVAIHGDRLDVFEEVKTNQSLMDCPSEPVLCPP